MPGQRYEPRLILDLKMILGEGPLWDFNRKKLYFVDIETCRLYQYDPHNEQVTHHTFDRLTTAVALHANGSLLLAQEDRLIEFLPETRAIRPLTELEADNPQNRSNDGKTGPDGRFYIGTMDRNGQRRSGGLYRLDRSGQLERLLSGCTISNGMAWSADHRIFYYIDSPTRVVRAYDFNPAGGEITNARIVVEIPEDRGIPDGMTIDTDGNLWVAHHGGGCVACYDPRDGSIVGDINLPCSLVTSCAFGGPTYDTLYITTARQGMSAEEIERSPLSGGLFQVQTGQRGRPDYLFSGE